MTGFRFLKRFGIAVFSVGAITLAVCLVTAVYSREPVAAVIGLLAHFLLGGTGAALAIAGHMGMHADDKVLERGEVYDAKIFRHAQDRSMLMNGSPLTALVVRYFGRDGEIAEDTVRTGSADAADWPRGSTVTIRVLDGKAALVRGSLSDRKLYREDDLLDPDVDPNRQVSSVSARCPSCGASVTVPLGMARHCPYCGRKIRLTDRGKIFS